MTRVLTVITTIMTRFSLLPGFRQMRKRRSTGDMSVIPCVMLYTHCFAAMLYAYVIDDMMPLFATSVLGIVVGGLLAFFFYRWADNKCGVLKVFAISFVVCLLVATYTVFALTGVTGQSNSFVGTTLGFVTIGTTIGLYISPMATIARVIRTKTSSSMPFTMGIVNVCNTIRWILYSILVPNIFILAPNIGGLTFGSTQLILTFIYPRKTTSTTKLRLHTHLKLLTRTTAKLKLQMTTLLRAGTSWCFILLVTATTTSD